MSHCIIYAVDLISIMFPHSLIYTLVYVWLNIAIELLWNEPVFFARIQI